MNTSWIPAETPVLESVFVTHAPDAVDVTDIAAAGIDAWMWSPLSYAELLEWTEEIH